MVLYSDLSPLWRVSNRFTIYHYPSSSSEPTITVGNETLKVTDRFCYLGSTLSSSANIDAEVENRIAKASSTFGRLRKTVWERRGIKTSTKVKVYRATVIPTLLYACETWTLYERHTRKLQRFHMNCLRRILGISWQEKIPDTEVLALAEIPSMQALLKKILLRYAGHVARMPDERLPKRLFFGELAKGKRNHGGQKKRYKDTLKTSLKQTHMNPATWETEAQKRSVWRCTIHNATKTFEEERVKKAKEKRQI